MAHFRLFLILSGDIELTEKVEGNDSINVHNNCQQHQGQNQLFSIVCNGLENNFQGSNTNGHIQKMGSKEEVIVVTQNREYEISKLIQKWLKNKIEYALHLNLHR